MTSFIDESGPTEHEQADQDSASESDYEAALEAARRQARQDPLQK